MRIEKEQHEVAKQKLKEGPALEDIDAGSHPALFMRRYVNFMNRQDAQALKKFLCEKVGRSIDTDEEMLREVRQHFKESAGEVVKHVDVMTEGSVIPGREVPTQQMPDDEVHIPASTQVTHKEKVSSEREKAEAAVPAMAELFATYYETQIGAEAKKVLESRAIKPPVYLVVNNTICSKTGGHGETFELIQQQGCNEMLENALQDVLMIKLGVDKSYYRKTVQDVINKEKVDKSNEFFGFRLPVGRSYAKDEKQHLAGCAVEVSNEDPTRGNKVTPGKTWTRIVFNPNFGSKNVQQRIELSRDGIASVDGSHITGNAVHGDLPVRISQELREETVEYKQFVQAVAQYYATRVQRNASTVVANRWVGTSPSLKNEMAQPQPWHKKLGQTVRGWLGAPAPLPEEEKDHPMGIEDIKQVCGELDKAAKKNGGMNDLSGVFTKYASEKATQDLLDDVLAGLYRQLGFAPMEKILEKMNAITTEGKFRPIRRKNEPIAYAFPPREAVNGRSYESVGYGLLVSTHHPATGESTEGTYYIDFIYGSELKHDPGGNPKPWPRWNSHEGRMMRKGRLIELKLQDPVIPDFGSVAEERKASPGGGGAKYGFAGGRHETIHF